MEQDAFQAFGVLGGVQFLDRIQRRWALLTGCPVAGVRYGVPAFGGPDPTTLPQAGEHAGSGAGTQVFGRDDAPVHAASCGTQQQGVGGGQLGEGFNGGSKSD